MQEIASILTWEFSLKLYLKKFKLKWIQLKNTIPVALKLKAGVWNRAYSVADKVQRLKQACWKEYST